MDRSYQVDIIVCAVVTAVIGSVFVALRFYTRRVIVYVLGWEDWLIMAAQVSVVLILHWMGDGRRIVLTFAACVDLLHRHVCGLRPWYNSLQAGS